MDATTPSLIVTAEQADTVVLTCRRTSFQLELFPSQPGNVIDLQARRTRRALTRAARHPHAPGPLGCA